MAGLLKNASYSEPDLISSISIIILDNEWPKLTALVIGGILVGIFGYFVNWKQERGFHTKKDGQMKKNPPHSLFLVPIEYWSLIVLVPLAISYFW